MSGSKEPCAKGRIETGGGLHHRTRTTRRNVRAPAFLRADNRSELIANTLRDPFVPVLAGLEQRSVLGSPTAQCAEPGSRAACAGKAGRIALTARVLELDGHEPPAPARPDERRVSMERYVTARSGTGPTPFFLGAGGSITVSSTMVAKMSSL